MFLARASRGATVGFAVEAEAIFYFSWVSDALLFFTSKLRPLLSVSQDFVTNLVGYYAIHSSLVLHLTGFSHWLTESVKF